ncbi:MAG: MarR family winged helix-turn-helix transcriptional regulator [Treponema sp.]|nr:MarR family winged helix-turn-helix transcriptional regulator [Treponema sp.]MDD7450034.1 MarR family winged helix-turn-helix transcriptional regulator [Treponema sp.]MDY2923857.1 MarR family winged helix-turn-helix transcriptional regulator [Treponema sp.]MDY5684618.1 MarR family winged helix-turn-helix transcriptional regulator [Treponema sp.]
MENGKTEGGMLISQIHQISQRIWNSILKNYNLQDLSGARGRIIFALWNTDNIPIKELVKKTSLDKATLTGIIDRLERDGFIIRSHNPQDKREIIISRTGKDEIFKTKIPAASDEQNALFYKDFSQEEIFTFEKMLKKILKNCKDAEEKLI